MRSLLTIILILGSLDVFAQNFSTKLDLLRNDFESSRFLDEDIEFHKDYPIEFKLVSSEAICPDLGPGFVSCKAIGTKVVIKATFRGCMDTLASFDADYHMYDNKLIIEVEAKGLYNPASDRVRCIKMPEVTKTITAPFEHFDGIEIRNINTLQ